MQQWLAKTVIRFIGWSKVCQVPLTISHTNSHSFPPIRKTSSVTRCIQFTVDSVHNNNHCTDTPTS